MEPQIAMCNIFDQDAEKLAEFAFRNGFTGIDWSIDPSLSEREFLSCMQRLSDFQLRYHGRFFGVDIAYTDKRGDDSLEMMKRTVEQVALVGGKHMTIHSGLGNSFGEGIDESRLIDNLSVLAAYGNHLGVAVALENLMTPLTNDPRRFQRIVSESDSFVTVDIGHAQGVKNLYPGLNICSEYVIPNREKLLNAHIYNTELEGYGHVAPTNLSDISSRLDLLCLAESCDWWVVELMNPEEVLSTRDLLRDYLDGRSLQPVVEQQYNDPLPLFAA